MTVEGGSNGYKNLFGKWLESKPVRYLGKISYGIYVYHLIVRFLFWKGFFAIITRLSFLHVDFTGLVRFVAVPVVNFLLYSAISVGIASLSWYFIEQPANRLKRFIGYTSSARRAAETRKSATPASPEEKALEQKIS
jgi:peptidoglycan/LPS O-acetylase OafA/YrhL